MKQLLETLKSARWVEMLLIIVLLCAILTMMAGENESTGLSEDEKMERILSSVSGAGKVQVLRGGEDGGILVLCEGADDVRVVLSIQRAVQTLTSLPLDKIEIVKSG